ncbi:uncharacterized protein LOC128393222 [Panonychus citri]|uniref:uncharacterized protein LOC128393222 n=1 Tax=Panonychus citri TaxID=50023 RepID=UPI002307629B|nr:uncharacterized protein LOC128393222 [Panonychus citri]
MQSVPHNISVVLTQWLPPAIRVSWAFNPGPDLLDPSMITTTNQHHHHHYTVDDKTNSLKLSRMFRIVYFPVGSKTRYVQEVPINMRNVTIEQLVPNTEYQLLINVVSSSDLIGNSSHFIRFVSPDGEPHRFVRGGMNPLRIRLDVDPEIIVRPGEAILVSCILIFWVLVILWFIKKWGKIRTLEPTRHRTDTDISSFSQQTRFTSIGGANIPQVHTSDSRNSLELVNCTSTGNFQRPRLNSVFLVSPSRRSSLLPEEYNIPRRYKSAEDLKSLVLQITQTKGLHTGDLNVHKSSSLQPPQCLSSNIYNGNQKRRKSSIHTEEVQEVKDDWEKRSVIMKSIDETDYDAGETIRKPPQ